MKWNSSLTCIGFDSESISCQLYRMLTQFGILIVVLILSNVSITSLKKTSNLISSFLFVFVLFLHFVFITQPCIVKRRWRRKYRLMLCTGYFSRLLCALLCLFVNAGQLPSTMEALQLPISSPERIASVCRGNSVSSLSSPPVPIRDGHQSQMRVWENPRIDLQSRSSLLLAIPLQRGFKLCVCVCVCLFWECPLCDFAMVQASSVGYSVTRLSVCLTGQSLRWGLGKVPFAFNLPSVHPGGRLIY